MQEGFLEWGEPAKIANEFLRYFKGSSHDDAWYHNGPSCQWIRAKWGRFQLNLFNIYGYFLEMTTLLTIGMPM